MCIRMRGFSLKVRRGLRWCLMVLLVLCATLPACVSQAIKSVSVPAVRMPSTDIVEDLLLDVSIAIFDAGLDDYDEGQQVYPEVRKAEAHYMPNLLSETMQNSGAWGAVRVVPDPKQISDLMVEGKILYSDGEELRLHITATDSRAYVWLDKEYHSIASRYAYRETSRKYQDPFQALYNTISNDLLERQEKLRSKERENIRLVTELLFARSFSSDAFDGYLEQNRKGLYRVKRLPAEDDPMLEWVRSIRDRDHLFIDTMQEYYISFNQQMISPYQEWRKLSYQEAVALKELQADSRRRMLAGGIALLAGIAGAVSDSRTGRAAGSVAILGGGYLLKSGLEMRNEVEMHVEALEELGQSLEAEITPQVIELQDRTVMLSGNVEDQYAQWRELLAEIYRTEIGELELPEDEVGTAATL
ncbi:MAG: hypothetical protein V3R56_05725 [Xanthomonadales bacterium]